MIDLHCHLLPGIDDGPDTLAESVDMARMAHRAGLSTIVCTPHMIEHFPTDPTWVHAEVARVQSAIDDADIPVNLVAGAEIALSYLPRLDDDDLRLASVGGRGRWLLIEMPYHGWPVELAPTLTTLEMRGYGVILAHPERAEAVQRQPDRMREIIGRGALVQLSAASFLGEHGDAARRTAAVLLAGGIGHFIATDAHSPGPWRPPELEPGVQAAADAIDVDRRDLDWMVLEGPAAVVGGTPVRPPRLGRARRTTPTTAPPRGSEGGGPRPRAGAGGRWR